MAIVLQKGKPYSVDYTSVDFPILTTDWSGDVSIYKTYPGTKVASYPLALAGNTLQLRLSIADILNLSDGVYSFVATMTNSILGCSISSLDYATVVPISVSSADKTTISMTIAKSDGTPAGKETQELVNTDTGTTIVLGWKGVTVTASHAVANEMSGSIIGTETISTETNAAGYAQLAVIKGSTVTISCPAFGKTVTVDTTGLDTVDLSSYF